MPFRTEVAALRVLVCGDMPDDEVVCDGVLAPDNGGWLCKKCGCWWSDQWAGLGNDWDYDKHEWRTDE